MEPHLGWTSEESGLETQYLIGRFRPAGTISRRETREQVHRVSIVQMPTRFDAQAHFVSEIPSFSFWSGWILTGNWLNAHSTIETELLN